jgi:hypothetical protein
MSVNVVWDNPEQTVLRYTFEGQWTWDEYFPVLMQGREKMGTVSHYVSIINDMLGTQHVPPAFLTNARSVIHKRPKNTGLAVFVSKQMMFTALHRVLIKFDPLIHANYLLTPTLEEARTKIRQWQQDHQQEKPINT